MSKEVWLGCCSCSLSWVAGGVEDKVGRDGEMEVGEVGRDGEKGEGEVGRNKLRGECEERREKESGEANQVTPITFLG